MIFIYFIFYFSWSVFVERKLDQNHPDRWKHLKQAADACIRIADAFYWRQPGVVTEFAQKVHTFNHGHNIFIFLEIKTIEVQVERNI